MFKLLSRTLCYLAMSALILSVALSGAAHASAGHGFTECGQGDHVMAEQPAASTHDGHHSAEMQNISSSDDAGSDDAGVDPAQHDHCVSHACGAIATLPAFDGFKRPMLAFTHSLAGPQLLVATNPEALHRPPNT